MEIVATGLFPNDTNPSPNCYGFASADLPWATTAANIITDGSINTSGSGLGIPSVVNAANSMPPAAGTLSGVEQLQLAQ